MGFGFERFKLLSWNILQGGGSRTEGILEAIKSHDADTVVLSEFRNGTHGRRILQCLEDMGYDYLVPSEAPDKENAVIIASRPMCGPASFTDREPDHPHSMLRAEFDAFDLYGVYLPHKKKHTWFDVMLAELKENDMPAIIAGDFNTGINHVDQAGNTFWYSDRLIELERAGYKDAFRHVHGDVREFSWFSAKRKDGAGGNGFRYDHTWVSETLLPFVKTCEYAHTEREAGLSDHSPMVLELSA